MTTAQIKEAVEQGKTISILKDVFGLQSGQTLSEFLRECAPVKQDAAFMSDVTAYALANATA